jgi:DNA topoisomerase-1
MAQYHMAPRQSSRQPHRTAVPTVPAAAAQTAGLHYVTDTQPGIRRHRWGKGFRYLGSDNTPIRSQAVVRRIKALMIPPAWTQVWICAWPEGHLQATGRDAKGRKQYRYHPRWRAVRDATKYDRLVAFGEGLPALRRRLDQDLARPGLPRDKVLATVVRLLETTLIRIGNPEYARENRSFGLTTMRDRHVHITGTTATFQFRGKSGKHHTVRLTDRRVVRIIQRCQDLPGYELFQYLDADGQPQTIDSADVNAYLRAVTGQDCTAKDVRTWAGTVLTAATLWECAPFTSHAEAQRNIVQTIERVAKRLGNTRAVCRKCYVHPFVLEAYLDSSLLRMPRPDALLATSTIPAELHPEEAAVLAVLKQHAAAQDLLPQRAS